jgi:glycerol kinase
MSQNDKQIFRPPTSMSSVGSVQIQVMAKGNVKSVLLQTGATLSEIRAKLLNAMSQLSQSAEMIEGSMTALRQASLLGQPIDRDAIAGEVEAKALRRILAEVEDMVTAAGNVSNVAVELAK